MIRLNLIRPQRLQAVEFTRQDLIKVGGKMIDTIQKRCLRGQTANDCNSKPLSARYRAKKVALGQPGIRNEMFSGSMLGALTVVEVDQRHVTIGFTRQAELVKATKTNEKGDWFGISKSDEGIVLSYAERILLNKKT